MNGSPLRDQQSTTILGVYLVPYVQKDKKLCERIYSSHVKIQRLIHFIGQWRTTTRQRRLIVKTFVFSLVDYMLYLQPTTPAVIREANRLELSSLRYILKSNLTQSQTARALLVSKVLPIRLRRKRYLSKAVAKFYTAAARVKNTQRDQQNWNALSKCGSVSPFIKQAKLPATSDEMGSGLTKNS